MEPTRTLDPDTLNVESFATFEPEMGAEVVETGCVMPCGGFTVVMP